jgi:hypothetical protein
MKNLNYITVLSLLFTIQALWAYQPSGYHWLSSDMPIIYEINQNGTPDCEGEFGAIHQAFDMPLTTYVFSLYSTIYANLKPERRVK